MTPGRPRPEMHIGPMTDADAAAVLAIYQAGIEEGNATFETQAPDWPTFTAAKIPAFSAVAVDDQASVLGWVAASAVSSRPCYRGVIEHSVYVHPEARGLGVAKQLLQQLITTSEEQGVWTIQLSIFPENTASAALHQSAGFRTVGTRVRIAQHYGRWRDTVFIERRSDR